MSEKTSILQLDCISHSFQQGDKKLDVLRGVDLSIESGEIVGLLGPSGSGKSTLLHIAGLLEKPHAGKVFLNGQACSEINDNARTALRLSHLGFVYQFHHLLPEFTALENIILPQMLAGKDRKIARNTAFELLSNVELVERAAHMPSELSGGEQQRVAIVRALSNSPKILLADEPTGNLDEETALKIFGVFKDTVKNSGAAALIATHNIELATKMDRTVKLQDGKLV
ncbi:MAG: ABC transporter [Rhodospirillaceae bacterium]|nr:ABC transporter [Rhodospirillaceae bacterium]|tara:strand:+ start:2008 stop:2688 length:681 start_codon:yes stop_codon:yes gene_type:complete